MDTVAPGALAGLSRGHGRPWARYKVSGRGFFSEFNILAFALAHCLVHGRRLCVDISNSAGPWRQLFPGLPRGAAERPETDGSAEEISLEPKLPDWSWNPQWAAMRKQVRDGCLEARRVGVPELGFEGSYSELVVLAARTLFQPNATLVERAAAARRELELDGRPYAAVQLRRGDKVEGYDNGRGRFLVETEIADFAAYAECLEKLAPDISDVFVIADDYTAVEDARSGHPRFRFHTLCEPHERGYFHAVQQDAAPEIKLANLEKLLITVLIAIGSEAFVGTYWSNLSIGVYLLHPHQDRCAAMDLARPWSPYDPLFMRGRDEL